VATWGAFGLLLISLQDLIEHVLILASKRLLVAKVRELVVCLVNSVTQLLVGQIILPCRRVCRVVPPARSFLARSTRAITSLLTALSLINYFYLHRGSISKVVSVTPKSPSTVTLRYLKLLILNFLLWGKAALLLVFLAAACKFIGPKFGKEILLLRFKIFNFPVPVRRRLIVHSSFVRHLVQLHFIVDGFAGSKFWRAPLLGL
jgi:hypothetical protein